MPAHNPHGVCLLIDAGENQRTFALLLAQLGLEGLEFVQQRRADRQVSHDTELSADAVHAPGKGKTDQKRPEKPK